MTAKRRLGTTGYYVVSILIAVVAMIPFLWMISTSLKSRGALMSIPIEWIPAEPSLDAYGEVFSRFPFLKTIGNSLFISVSYTVITLISASMAAFAFAKIRFRCANLLLKLYLATMMIPTQVTMIPLFVIMNRLGLIDSYASVILPSLFRPFAVFMLVQQMRTVPADEIRPSKWRVHPLEILAAVLAVVLCVWLLKRPWNYLVAIILVLLSSIYVWNRMKISKKVEKTEPEKILEEITPQEEKIPTDRLKWELERNALELGDKRVRYSNLKEDLEELDGISDEERILNAQAEARQLAIDKIQELSGEMQKKLRGKLNDRVSEIMEFITEGKYTRLNVEEGLNISLLSEGRKVDIARVSQGTAEQVYFALRMAASEVLLEEELPVILDDTFVSYDEERLESVLEWLAKSGKQVLLFTCQKREMKILSEMGVKNCNYIKLQ